MDSLLLVLVAYLYVVGVMMIADRIEDALSALTVFAWPVSVPVTVLLVGLLFAEDAVSRWRRAR